MWLIFDHKLYTHLCIRVCMFMHVCVCKCWVHGRILNCSVKEQLHLKKPFTNLAVEIMTWGAVEKQYLFTAKTVCRNSATDYYKLQKNHGQKIDRKMRYILSDRWLAMKNPHASNANPIIFGKNLCRLCFSIDNRGASTSWAGEKSWTFISSFHTSTLYLSLCMS